jgi:hypothetical protein
VALFYATCFSITFPVLPLSSLPAPCLSPGDSTLVAEGSGESWEALTDATDVVAGSTAVHTERARLGTAVAIEPRGTDCG